jgi:hypothetical protein
MDRAHLRVARPAHDFADALRFYRDGLGFAVLASFEDHVGYDGVMLGHPGAPYHFEFIRKRGEIAPQAPSTENVLVFCLPDRREWERAVARMAAAGFAPVPASNPYWDARGDVRGHRPVSGRLAMGGMARCAVRRAAMDR